MQGRRSRAQAEHTFFCGAAEHHRMQPLSAPADYKLLRDGAVAALQVLFLEVVALGRQVCNSEANQRPITIGSRMLVAEIGESCCKQQQFTCCCNHECSIQPVSKSVFCTSAQSCCHLPTH